MNVLDKVGEVLIAASDIIYSLSSGWLMGEEEPPQIFTEDENNKQNC